MLKIGNTSFNCSEFKGCTKEAFIQRYRGKLDGADISEAFDQIQNELKKTEPRTKNKIEAPTEE